MMIKIYIAAIYRDKQGMKMVNYLADAQPVSDVFDAFTYGECQ